MYKGIIYCYTCIINQKKYIGQTIDEYNRRRAFFTKERYCTLRTASVLSKFDSARKKYGIEMFAYDIIDSFICTSKKQLIKWLNDKETYYIDFYDTFYNGYNSTTGGFNGYLSQETKDKISKSLMGRPMSELTKQNFTFKGHFHTDENKKLISDRCRQRYKDKTKHPMFGKCHSEESKLKNSNSRRGKCVGKNNKNSTSVECFTKSGDFLKRFDTITDAIKWLNIQYNKNINPRQPGQICKCCNGKAKSAYGLIWKYV